MKDKSRLTKRIKRVSGIALCAAVAVILIIFISTVIQLAMNREPSLFGYRFYYILTDSMSPELKVNDAVLSKTLKDAEAVRKNVGIGDTITFLAEYGDQKGMLITHKVTEGAHFDETYGREVLSTRGVRTGATDDPPVPIENVRAKMVRKLTFIGVMYRFITTRTGLILLITLPASALALSSAAKPLLKAHRIKQQKKKRSDIIAEQAVADYIARKEREKLKR